MQLPIDDEPTILFRTRTSSNESWPVGDSMHLTASWANSGKCGGRKAIDGKSLPVRMEFYDFRVYQRAE